MGYFGLFLNLVLYQGTLLLQDIPLLSVFENLRVIIIPTSSRSIVSSYFVIVSSTHLYNPFNSNIGTMATFEQLASDLTGCVHELKSKKEKLKRQIEEDENECERIESELEVLLERRKEIQASAKQYKSQREELFTVITETEETKKKIIESLKFLGANLKRYRDNDRR